MAPVPPDLPLGSALEFMRTLWALDHALQRRSKWMAQTHGVTAPQRLVLRVIERGPGVSAGRLAKILKLHPSTLTGVIRRLERRGLIARQVDRADRRRALLTITARGRAMNRATQGVIEANVLRVLRRTPKARVASMVRIIDSLVGGLDG
jgi:MarR family transcriptional regulator, organic hydroperoxide resistance regulator